LQNVRRAARHERQDGRRQSGRRHASTLAYLNAVAAAGSDAAQDVVPQMKKFKGQGQTVRRCHDPAGRPRHPSNVSCSEVKKPDESKYPYDYYRLVSTIAADQAFRPIAAAAVRWLK